MLRRAASASVLLLAGVAAAASACHRSSGYGPPSLSGRVVDESGSPIAAASLAWAGGAAAGVSSDGTFRLTTDTDPSTPQALAISAPGYAPIYRAMRPPVAGVRDLGDVPLRQEPDPVIRRLPAAGEPPVTVALERSGAGVSVELAAGQLVDAQGQPASGDVEVRLQYWHPNENLDSAPALLLSAENDQILALKCFGMAGIDVQQGGKALSVAPGAHITLVFQQTPDLAALWPGTNPALYSLDETSGMWSHEGDKASGALTFDPNTQAARASLSHMSYWNVDGAIYPSNGGCVTGLAYDQCSPLAPLRNAPVQVWFLTHEEVKNFPIVQTNSSGRYCVATPISDFQAYANIAYNDPRTVVRTMVTGSTMDNTLQCNPLPPACRICSPIYEAWPSPSSFCNKCIQQIPGHPYYGDVPIQQIYTDTCSPPTPEVSLTGCTFCPGSSPTDNRCTLPGSDGTFSQGKCAELPPAYIRGPSCQCALIGQACGPGGQCCPDQTTGTMNFCNPTSNRCVPCVVFKQAYDQCGPDEPCCTRPKDLPLSCLDNVCVPPVTN